MRIFLRLAILPLLLASTSNSLRADPILTSWFTQNSGVLARVIQSGTLTTPVTIWPSAGVVNNNTGSAAQSLSVYSDVQRIRFSASNVYINANGLASYTMGPFYVNGGGLFGFWPVSQHYQVRITRTPAIATPTKTKHPGGMIGMMVNGVAIYDLGDAFSYKQSAAVDQMGANGDGYWSRDALAVEVVTFDPGFAHQPGLNGQYHYHAEPKALRYQLGDNMTATYNASTNTNTYTENTSNLHHSPVLGWSFDGCPIYGPYGYTSAMNASSGLSRMRSGFVLRNAANQTLYGTADLVATGRTTLPRWAAIAQGYVTSGTGDYTLTAAQYGPATTYTSGVGVNLQTYSPGRYIGDYDYLGDRGQLQGTDFDLDQYNGRTCVTPEFPGGTYAYFVSIDASGNTAFPHMLGKEYYGEPNGGTSPVISEAVSELFNGGPNTQEAMRPPAVNASNGNVTLTWSSVEGGTYKLEATSDLAATWTTLSGTLSATANSTQTSTTENGAAMSNNKRFYRVGRTALAGYDYWTNVPSGTAKAGTTTGTTIGITSPPVPAATVSSAVLQLSTGNVNGTSLARPTNNSVNAKFAIPSNEPVGAKTIVVTYSTGATATLVGGLTIN